MITIFIYYDFDTAWLLGGTNFSFFANIFSILIKRATKAFDPAEKVSNVFLSRLFM